jgi:hypothetical protein
MHVIEDTESTEKSGKYKMQFGTSAIEKLQFAICNLQCFLHVLCALCGYLVFAVSVASAGRQEAVPVDGEAFAGELLSVDAEGRVTFEVGSKRPSAEQGGASRTLQLNELVRWGHPVEPRPQTIVVLADGGQIVTAADWSSGAAVRLDGRAVVILSNTFGEVRVPRRIVRGVVFALRRHPTERERLVERIRSDIGIERAGLSSTPSGVVEQSPTLSRQSGRGSDMLFLSNGDRVSGTLVGIERGSLSIKTDGGTAKLPLSRVEAVIFGSRQPSAVIHPPELIVGLRDGSLLYANKMLVDKSRLNLEMADDVKLAGGSAADLVAFQSLGGRFVYLSDLEPADYRHVPYLSIDWPYKLDRNVLGEPLVVGGRRYLKGISMHSAARLTYRLDGKYNRFDSTVAVDDSAGQRGSVTFGVYVLRDGKLSEAYKSGIVRGGGAPERVSVDVSAADGLTLTVDYADRGDELDRAVWLDARLVKD